MMAVRNMTPCELLVTKNSVERTIPIFSVFYVFLLFRSPVLNLTTLESHKSYIQCYILGDTIGST